MKTSAVTYLLSVLLSVATGAALACEFKAGETKFVDYANCRYGPDNIVVVDLPEGSSWEQCVYHVEPFRPGTLLAVTKQKDGKEVLSINERGQIGNPCYLTKRSCDAALKAYQQGTN